MLLLPGSVALSAPRFSRLSAQITELDPALTLKRAFFIYAVDAADDVDGNTLSALLQPWLKKRGQRIAVNIICCIDCINEERSLQCERRIEFGYLCR